MIISKRKYEERIREAVEKEMHNHAMREEQREVRREVYGELDRIRMHMSTLESRIESMEHMRFSGEDVYAKAVRER